MKKIILIISAIIVVTIIYTSIGYYNDIKTNEKIKQNLTSNVSKAQEYQDFFTKSYFEQSNKIVLTQENINNELNKSVENKNYIIGENGNLSKESVKEYFKNNNIKLTTKLYLENLLEISLETILDENNNIKIRYYSIRTNEKTEIVDTNIELSEKDKAFDLNEKSLNQIIGYIKLDISNLDEDFKKIIQEYANIHNQQLILDENIMQVYIRTLTNEL